MEKERLPRIKSIRKKCLDCSENMADVRSCTIHDCPLYPYRMGHRAKGTTPSKAIKLYCYECSGENMAERRECPVKKCPLWRYKTGKEDKGE